MWNELVCPQTCLKVLKELTSQDCALNWVGFATVAGWVVEVPATMHALIYHLRARRDEEDFELPLWLTLDAHFYPTCRGGLVEKYLKAWWLADEDPKEKDFVQLNELTAALSLHRAQDKSGPLPVEDPELE